MKKILLIVITAILAVSTSLSLEPMKVAFVYTVGTPTSVRVQLADNTNSALFTGENYTAGITPNGSGVIVVNVRDHAGSGTTWANFQASDVNSFNTLDIYVNGTLYAQYRLDALILSQSQNGTLDQDGNLTPPEDGSGNIGTDKLRWKGAYFKGNTIHIGPAEGEADDEEMRLSYDDNTNTGSIVIDDESVIEATKDLITVNKRISQVIGNDNIAFGRNAFSSTATGSLNTSIGYAAGTSSTTSFGNTFIGGQAGFNTTNGDGNTAIGLSSGYNTNGANNTYVGIESGGSITTGSDNTFLGKNAGANGSQKVDAQNSIAIGQGTYTTADNQVVIGNSSITETQLRGATLVDLAGGGTQNLQVNNTGKIVTGGPKIESGTYTPIWTTINGFIAPPSPNFATYSRVGDLVTVVCRFDLTAAFFGPGTNTATISLPPSLTVENTAVGALVSGTFSSDFARNLDMASDGYVFHNNSTTVMLKMLNSPIGPASSYCTFTYKTDAP